MEVLNLYCKLSIANKTHLINGVGAVVARSETQSQPFWLWVDHYSGNRYVRIGLRGSEDLKGLAQAKRRPLRGSMSRFSLEDITSTIIRRLVWFISLLTPVPPVSCLGSFGRVMLARNRRSGEFFAMKRLKKSDIIKLRQVDHVISENTILADIEHPFLVSYKNDM